MVILKDCLAPLCLEWPYQASFFRLLAKLGLCCDLALFVWICFWFISRHSLHSDISLFQAFRYWGAVRCKKEREKGKAREEELYFARLSTILTLGTGYSDFNECSTNVYHCDANAFCNKADGCHNYTCSPGYIGNGTSCAGRLSRQWRIQTFR